LPAAAKFWLLTMCLLVYVWCLAPVARHDGITANRKWLKHLFISCKWQRSETSTSASLWFINPFVAIAFKWLQRRLVCQPATDSDTEVCERVPLLSLPHWAMVFPDLALLRGNFGAFRPQTFQRKHPRSFGQLPLSHAIKCINRNKTPEFTLRNGDKDVYNISVFRKTWFFFTKIQISPDFTGFC
jgi:hypothetical protein